MTRRGVADAAGLFDPAPPQATAAGAAGHRARMRQKLLEGEGAGLSDQDLLEMILFLALPRRDTKPIARALVARFGGLAGAIAAPAQALRGIEGLGDAGIAALRVVQVAALRLGRSAMADRDLTKLSNWQALTDYLTAVLAREPVEHFRVLFLDTRNHLIADERLGTGTVNHAPVYPREIMRRAIELHATALILVHNHPSGDPTPSRADAEMTREVVEAARMLGITVHDHLVVGRGGTASLRQMGLM